MNNKNMKIFTLSGAHHFLKALQTEFKEQATQMEVYHFADGEILAKPNCSVRGLDVFLIQSVSKPVNDKLMELLIAIDACKRASAKSINVIITYFGYSRQDRKSKPREPISFKLVADMLQTAGVNRILTFDIHSAQTQGFFNIPFDSLEVCWLLMQQFIAQTKITDFCIVAPDYGSVKRARDLSHILKTNLVIIDKRRPKPNAVEIANILGDCENKNCVIIDDMIDTGGTMLECAKILKEKKAKTISILATHGIFSKNAILNFSQALENKIVDHLYVSDTIFQELPKQFKQISISAYIVEILRRFEKGYASINELITKAQTELIKTLNKNDK